METPKSTRRRCQPSAITGMMASRYDMNMTGYRLLSVTPLTHDQNPSCAVQQCLSSGMQTWHSHRSSWPMRPAGYSGW